MFFGIDKDKIMKKSILVVSPDSSRKNLISEHLTVRGLEVKTRQANFYDLAPKDLDSNQLEAVVIDLETINDLEHTLDFIYKILPKNITCVVFANNDSIKIKQQFLNKGIRYLHFETQFDHLYAEMNDQQSSNIKSRSIHISVLGTKGGVGNSFVSYQLANIIYERYKNKTLLVQGAYSSFNLDLLSDRSFVVEDYREGSVCLYKENEETASVFEKFSNEKFNFIFYDHSIQCLDKDNIENVLNSSDCVVLVVNNELSSIRKAKEVLSANEFLSSVGQGANKIVIALNELTNYKTLSARDIVEVLGRDVDIVIPFNSGIKEIKSISKGKTHKELDKLASLVIGQDVKKGKVKTLFKGSSW